MNLHVYFGPLEEAEEEENQDKRKKEEEKSGQNNYYVLCRWNWSPFSAGVLLPNVFIPDFCILQPTVIETEFLYFSYG